VHGAVRALTHAEAAIETVVAYCVDAQMHYAAHQVDAPPWVTVILGLLTGVKKEKKDLSSDGGAS
jgi:hypothetical protein